MHRALVVVVAVLAVVLAGCGSDDGGGKASAKQVYADQLGAVSKPLQDAFADTDQVGANVTSAQIAAHREAQAAVIEDTVKKIRTITPPPALASTHRKLIEGLQELAASFRSGKDPKSLAKALRALASSTGAKKLTEVSAELKAQGVTVPSS